MWRCTKSPINCCPPPRDRENGNFGSKYTEGQTPSRALHASKWDFSKVLGGHLGMQKITKKPIIRPFWIGENGDFWSKLGIKHTEQQTPSTALDGFEWDFSKLLGGHLGIHKITKKLLSTPSG